MRRLFTLLATATLILGLGTPAGAATVRTASDDSTPAHCRGDSRCGDYNGRWDNRDRRDREGDRRDWRDRDGSRCDDGWSRYSDESRRDDYRRGDDDRRRRCDDFRRDDRRDSDHHDH